MLGEGTGKDHHIGKNTARKGSPLINACCSSSPQWGWDDCKDYGWCEKTDGKTDEKADEKADEKTDEKIDGKADDGWCVVTGGASEGAGGSDVQRLMAAVKDAKSAMAVVGSVAKSAVGVAGACVGRSWGVVGACVA